MRIVLNTLDNHFHRCRKVDDPTLCGASSAYSRGESVNVELFLTVIDALIGKGKTRVELGRKKDNSKFQ